MRLMIPLVLALAVSSCEPGASCDCTLTINGVTKKATRCGERLCFDSASFECGTAGTTEVASCSSTGGGAATGGGSASAAGGGAPVSGGRAGGSASSGGGGSSSGPSCSGTFSCLTTTCNAATELCNLTLKRCVANTTACRTKDSYCISATSVTTCRSGTRFRCTADALTGGVTMGCE